MLFMLVTRLLFLSIAHQVLCHSLAANTEISGAAERATGGYCFRLIHIYLASFPTAAVMCN